MLAIAGGKGGCGKTTTTYHLAVALARRGTPVVAVDTDTEMPDLHLLADVPPEPGLDAVLDGHPPTSVGHRLHHQPDVTVVPTGGVDTAAVPRALAPFQRVDPTVLLDCPAGAGRDATRPLRAATATLLVTTPAPAALRDTVKTAAMARELDAEPAGVVVVNRTDSGGAVTDALTEEDARQLFDCPVLATVPAASGDPGAAPPVRRAYMNLSRVVTGRNI